MKLSNKIVYFLGIGGIGMSALARWFKQQGAIIYGYDLHSSEITDSLVKEGMIIHFDEDTNLIPDNTDTVIYTPAIPEDNIELVYFRNNDIPVFKRAEIVGNITKSYYTIAIAGTHGKTSISAMVTHLLKNASVNVTAFIGGICKNYNSNLILCESTDYLVVEADEYDRSLLQIEPDIAVISSMDEDHMDIYHDHSDLKNTFKEFALKLPEDGVLIYNSKLSSFNTSASQVTYGLNNNSLITGTNIHVDNGRFVLDIISSIGSIKNVRIPIPGNHNIENVLAAVGVSIEVGLTIDEIKSGIESFTGVERRMDFRVENENNIYIDDYAHHPEEIKATISAVKSLYPGKKITGIFQPHLFSRTRDFLDEFARELGELDELILMDIYPAREKPITGISSKLLLDNTNVATKLLLSDSEIPEYISKTKPEVLITMGAGDIGQLVKEIELKIIQK